MRRAVIYAGGALVSLLLILSLLVVLSQPLAPAPAGVYPSARDGLRSPVPSPDDWDVPTAQSAERSVATGTSGNIQTEYINML